ncbi:hypothetical protein GCM10009557_26050 [Virgisporangium ochraceum]|uniref:Uncharacterized protein n=1 Tax=Virgisporangium ochraceum TaxID=65505 RepID=A0A8J3ZJQ7_9ACTN|nr:hypothetical protein [Virgisporangium ochraceum]GIJ65114.1 hypothetical protein Voc01_000310 [Virgisporangium ochraceum]
MNVSTAEIDRYFAGVSAALADLPEQVRQELLEDLPDHLAEIAADDPVSLDDRLGPPAAYAAELRAAAGLDVTAPKRRASRLDAAMAALRPHLRTFDEQVGQLIGYDSLVEFLVQLRPAWWVLRGYLVALVVLNLFMGGAGIVPHDGAAGMTGWAVVLLLVMVSIRYGRRPPRLTRRIRPAWLAAAGVALLVVGLGFMYFDDGDYYYTPPSYQDSGAVYDGGQEVYVYTPDGRPVTNVRVYDRGGNPVPIGVPMGCERTDVYVERRGCLPEEVLPATPDGGAGQGGDVVSPSVSPVPSPSPSAS